MVVWIGGEDRLVQTHNWLTNYMFNYQCTKMKWKANGI